MNKRLKNAIQGDILMKTVFGKISFKIAVEFGRPSKECKNYGICKLDIINPEDVVMGGVKKNSCHTIISDAFFCFDTGTLELTFLISSLKKSCQKKHFASSYFTVEEIYQNKIWLNDFGFFLNIHINPGLYPIISREGFYILQFHKDEERAGT